MLPRFPLLFRAGGLLCDSAWTFGQTRSLSGDAEAARQRLPRTCALDGELVCCPQARLRTFPTGGVPLSGTRGKQICWIQIGGQKRRVEVTLDRSDATGALVPALPQRFRHKLAAAMTELGEFGAARGNFEQGAARTCNGAFQQSYEHPWGAKSHTRAKLFLPGTIRNLFGDDRLAYGHDLMDEAAMQTLAVRGESRARGWLCAAGWPDTACCVSTSSAASRAFLMRPSFIVVVRVVGATLPVHLALQPSDRLGIGSQFGAEHLQAWGAPRGARWQWWRGPGPGQRCRGRPGVWASE